MFARSNKRKNKIVSNSYSYNKLSKLVLSSTTIATVVAKTAKNAKNIKLKSTPLHVLIDSGSDESFINHKHALHGKSTKIVKPTVWATGAGSMHTKRESTVKFKLNEFSSSKEIEWKFHVDESDLNSKSIGYDMIIGLDLMSELGLIINCRKNVIDWEDIQIPMTSKGTRFTERKQLKALLLSTEEPVSTASEKSRLINILDAKYEKANLDDLAEQSKNLNDNQQKALRNLLGKYEDLFDGTLGDFDTEPVKLETKEGTCPVHSKPFPIPHIRKETFRKELCRMEALGILKKDNTSKWASPTFIIPKPNGTVRMVSDFRKVNTNLVRKPYPIPKISGIMQELEGFQYATALDLNMGYYTIRLDPGSQDICTIITPWGKYKYLRMPMGISCAPDIFQERMSYLMEGLEFARTYLDDLLCLTKGSFDTHLEHIEEILIRLRNANLKVNASKSTFCRTEINYLGYVVTREGIKPQPKKLEAIMKIAQPENVREVRRFLGMVQYYRDLWQHRSHILAPLTELTGKKKNAKFNWTDECQAAFEQTKKLLMRDIMLAYPNFSKKFVIHTDASDRQLGAVISQDNKPIAFYSRKLNSAQRRYTTTERELLSIVETLKEFKTILLGYKIEIFTDHKNLVHETTLMSSDRCMRWRLIMEEYGPDIHYIPGPDNVVADALSRLPMVDNDASAKQLFARHAQKNKQTEDVTQVCPLDIAIIAEYQQKELKRGKYLKDYLKNPKSGYSEESYDDVQIITYKNKLYIPLALRARILNWYHLYLCHPGDTRLAKTIQQSCDWPGLVNQAKVIARQCEICRKFKKTGKRKYGKLPAKQAETEPWAEVDIDLIGPYTIETNQMDKNGSPIILTLTAMTFIDPVTGWFEIAEVPVNDKSSARVSQLFNYTWLCRYPRPKRVRFDNGSEFKRDFIPLLDDFAIKPKPTTIKNPQSNAIVERVHQVVGDMLRTKDLKEYTFDSINPWGQILNEVAWAIRSTHHTTNKASPGQLVFGRDMIFNTPYHADWDEIAKNKQKIINKSNVAENAKRLEYDYEIDDDILIARDGHFRKLEGPYLGPYRIVQVYTNGTVRIRRGTVTERINIRRLTPYTVKQNE